MVESWSLTLALAALGTLGVRPSSKNFRRATGSARMPDSIKAALSHSSKQCRRSMVGTVPNLSWEASSGDGDGRIFRQCTEVIVATQHLPWGTIAGSNDHFEIHDIVIDMNAVCWQRNANAIEIRRSATTDHNNLLPSGSKHVF